MYRDSLSPVQQVDFAFYLLFGFSFFVLLFLTLCTLWFIWRYHYTRNPKAADIRGNIKAEVLWTLVPSILVMGLFYYGWVGFRALRTVPENAMEVQVTARMWSWMFTYPNNKHSNVLVVPVNEPVKLRMTTKDVIHSFFAPAFRIKMDTVPGMETYAWFKAQRTGEYDIFCAEYCGTNHATMVSTIRAVTREEYDAWLAQGETGAGAQQLLEAQGCISCHSLDGTAGVGPSFMALWGSKRTVVSNGKKSEIMVDAAYVREAIIKPGAQLVDGYDDIMAPYTDFTPEQMDSIVAFIQSLGNAGNAGHDAHGAAGHGGHDAGNATMK
ncbi:cytochrome c oxidase subunit II [Desulfovibrio cuneatus]|uniref:cytochrome c oxidase subunit II n=1 Tax=Desulfovibrio cuneatus TaxID=159728 RepID=UPI000426EDC5|nr:cytochrome c oxidase subunit II [Desulfovibrio cuneatus]